MSTLTSVSNVWNNLKEIDLRPLREQALRGVKIALVGAPGSGRSELAAQMRRDPHHPEMETQSPVWIVDLQVAVDELLQADLVIVILKAYQEDFNTEKSLASKLVNLGQKVLLLVNYHNPPAGQELLSPADDIRSKFILHGSVQDIDFLTQRFVPAVINLLPDRLIGLGRHFPLFRLAIAQQMVNDTCFSNLAFSISTGLAETIPVLDMPLVVTDTVVLTKNQMYLVYKMGLMLGSSLEWRDYIAEFGSVLGAGFFWRQLARSLVGMIPVWGILPKVAVSYAGTYVVGNVVLQWYLTGRHVSASQMRQLYQQAYQRGLKAAQKLSRKLPRSKQKSNHTGELSQANMIGSQEIGGQNSEIHSPPKSRRRAGVCTTCGRRNARQAQYCQYCGSNLNI